MAKPVAAMKIFVILFLFAVVECNGEETNSITTRVFERDRDKDGKIDQRVETVSRGRTIILRVYTTIRGGITNISRSFFSGGEMVMTESDENGDGFFEKVAVYNPVRENELEVFERHIDGSVHPVSAGVLAAYKEQHIAISKFFEDFGKERDVEKGLERLDALVKESIKANKKITEEK
jgi:hypothetical protein